MQQFPQRQRITLGELLDAPPGTDTDWPGTLMVNELGNDVLG